MMAGVMSGTAVISCTSDEADEHGSIYGMVSVSGTAEPMRGIGVELYKSMIDYPSSFLGDYSLLLKTVTYDDGHFEFTDLMPGFYKLVVDAEGYETSQYSVEVEVGRTARADMQLTRLNTYMTVRTLAATDVKGDRATLNGSYSYTNYKNPKEVGFVYSTSSIPQNGGKTITASLETPYSVLVSGLQKGKYYYQAYAKNDIGIAYGEVSSFDISGQPSVTTLMPTNLTATTATLNARIDYEGDPAYTERGFVYSSSFPNPSVDDPETATTKVIISGTSQEYSANIAGLTENASYHVRAYAKNGDGVVYGESITFSAREEAPYIIIDGLAIQLSDLSSSSNHTAAKNMCSQSRVGGFSDWRLPTIGELATIYANKDKIKALASDWYWSDTQVSSGSSYYFQMYLGNGSTVSEHSSDFGRVRAVRTVR